MLPALEFRTFRSVTWAPWIVTSNIEFNRFQGEKYDCLSRLPHWVYQIMTKKASSVLNDCDGVLSSSIVEYWITRLATEYAKEPSTYEDLWSFSSDKNSIADVEEEPNAPSIWYDMARTEIRAGLKYEEARVLSFGEFCSMDEQHAVDWLNGDWKPYGSFSASDDYNTKRRLDFGGTV